MIVLLREQVLTVALIEILAAGGLVGYHSGWALGLALVLALDVIVWALVER